MNVVAEKKKMGKYEKKNVIKISSNLRWKHE